MAKITLFWCFENINFVGRIMELQVQFWHSSDLTLWRTGYVIYTKIDGWHSNAHCSWTGLQRKINKIIDPSTHQNHLLFRTFQFETPCMTNYHVIFEFVTTRNTLASQTNSGRVPSDLHLNVIFLRNFYFSIRKILAVSSFV